MFADVYIMYYNVAAFIYFKFINYRNSKIRLEYYGEIFNLKIENENALYNKSIYNFEL